MKLTRRRVLQGLGGVTLALPFLESFGPRFARAQPVIEPYAIFLRQGNGAAAAQSTELGSEPERFWPHALGSLGADSFTGRALEPLSPHRSRLLVVGGVHMFEFSYGDGHARGVLQSLTARGPTVEDAGGDSEAAGESLDHRIGRELNPQGRDSLYLYSGRNSGWLGGACISYRGPAQRRSPEVNPAAAYRRMVGTDGSLSHEAFTRLANRRRSVNDVVREQMNQLLSRPELSRNDRQRLDLHFSSIRDLEISLECVLDDERQRQLDGAESLVQSTRGDEVLALTRLHMDVAVLAVACGYTRSVAIQVGNGNDGDTRYPDPDDNGSLMRDNFHYLSHRRTSHGNDGELIVGSDLLHHKVDLQFAQTFAYLLDRLNAYEMPDGARLLDHGVSVWFNDLGNGPAHSRRDCPFVMAGSAGGFLRQGEYLRLSGDPTHNRVLNTIGAAVGLRNANGEWLDDFGDPNLPRGVMSDLIA